MPSYAQSSREIDTDPFIESALVDSDWSKASAHAERVDGRIIAGVVNHHALASDLIASFFARLRASRSELRRIVIIAPDHFSAGRDEVSTSIRPYRVESKTVFVDTDAVRGLIRDGFAMEEDGTLFEREHGIGAIIPFVSRAYPDAKIVPIVFRGTASQDRMQKLSDALKSLWDDQTVVIISADMSHYLTDEQALQNDETTLRSLKTKNVDIASLSDDYLDSGKSVASLFSAMASVYPDVIFTLFDHAISSDYGADPSNTTSYITGVWEEARSER
jgi:poly-gamma-glutamate synthesis protein (capsule biosynthesis protein)